MCDELCVFDHTSADFTLEKIMSLGLDKHADEIAEISAAASKELSIEQVQPPPLLEALQASLKPFAVLPTRFCMNIPTLVIVLFDIKGAGGNNQDVGGNGP